MSFAHWLAAQEWWVQFFFWLILAMVITRLFLGGGSNSTDVSTLNLETELRQLRRAVERMAPPDVPPSYSAPTIRFDSEGRPIHDPTLDH